MRIQMHGINKIWSPSTNVDNKLQMHQNVQEGSRSSTCMQTTTQLLLRLEHEIIKTHWKEWNRFTEKPLESSPGAANPMHEQISQIGNLESHKADSWLSCGIAKLNITCLKSNHRWKLPTWSAHIAPMVRLKEFVFAFDCKPNIVAAKQSSSILWHCAKLEKRKQQ